MAEVLLLYGDGACYTTEGLARALDIIAEHIRSGDCRFVLYGADLAIRLVVEFAGDRSFLSRQYTTKSDQELFSQVSEVVHQIDDERVWQAYERLGEVIIFPS